MSAPRTLDIHTHVLTEETIGLIRKEAPKVAPRMTAIDADSFILEIAGTPYRPFPRGGFVPYQAGRWAHGWQVRPEPKVNLKQSPQPWIERFYYDTILHSTKNLEFLIGSAGPARVLLGSDYPYDMGTGECVRQVRALSIPEADKATVLGTQAWSLLGGG